jgi:hypothetical protein
MDAALALTTLAALSWNLLGLPVTFAANHSEACTATAGLRMPALSALTLSAPWHACIHATLQVEHLSMLMTQAGRQAGRQQAGRQAGRQASSHGS